VAQKKTDIIAQLQKEILPLQGFRHALHGSAMDMGLGPIKYAFPNNSFPLGAVHEFICGGVEDVSASAGFITGILSKLMQNGGVSVWISSSQTIFPPALKLFGVDPDKIIFIHLQKEKEILWVIEESLKCDGLAAVVGHVTDLSFTISRRLQLAVEESRVTGFIIRDNSRNMNTTSCISRWRITSIPSISLGEIPGVSFPQWNVELLKIRNGKPGSWQIEWSAGNFRHVSKLSSMPREQQKKTG